MAVVAPGAYINGSPSQEGQLYLVPLPSSLELGKAPPPSHATRRVHAVTAATAMVAVAEIVSVDVATTLTTQPSTTVSNVITAP